MPFRNAAAASLPDEVPGIQSMRQHKPESDGGYHADLVAKAIRFAKPEKNEHNGQQPQQHCQPGAIDPMARCDQTLGG